MSKISSSDVRKVAQLARLELPEDQIETYTFQLEEILSYVDQLQEIDTQNIPPTTRAVEVVNSVRKMSLKLIVQEKIFLIKLLIEKVTFLEFQKYFKFLR